MRVKLLVEAGDMKPGPVLSQKLGPVGINMNQVIQKVNESTKDFSGLKVPVELDVNPLTKEFSIDVFSPPVSELLKKELGLEKGSATQKKLYVGNASVEQIISIAKTKLPDLLAKDLKSAVKTVVGTCASLGILIEDKPAVEFEQQVDKGSYDEEISNGLTETPAEKRAKLDKYFEDIKGEQERAIKKEEEEAAKEAAPEKEAEEEVAEKAGEETEKKEEKTEDKSKEEKPKKK